MVTSGDVAARPRFSRKLHASHSCIALCAVLMLGVAASPAQAQEPEPPILQKGDAVVTGHSGVALLNPAKGAKPEDFAIINQQGAVLQVFDLSQMYGRDDARLVKAPRFFSVTAGKIGQVFGVALDDGVGSPGNKKVPNIYATATSMFGLQLVKTTNGVRNRAKVGGPDRTWMGGQFGLGLGGGPGSIWKIDGRTGKVSLFANVKLGGVSNSGPALGNITFDSRTRQLFVSDFQTGMIHAFDLTGAEVAIYDHGAKGRPKAGNAAVAYDPAGSKAITDPTFNASEPSTWGMAAKARSVWGLAVSGRRLFYAVAEGPEIWSVGLKDNGRFKDDARVEIEVKAPSGDPVSDIAFARDGTIYLSQRGSNVSSYDYTVFAKPKTAAVLRYKKKTLPSGRVTWQPDPEEYAIGFPDRFRNTNGGIALGYGYDRFGFIRHDACEQTLWSTGELLRDSDQYKTLLKPGGPLIVHGLQGNSARLVRPANEAPFKTYFIDYDSHHSDPAYRGHMGDVAIWSSCPVAVAPPPKAPVGARIRIAKHCYGAAFGGQLHCKVTLTNTGYSAPTGRVGFRDFARIINGPPAAGSHLLILGTSTDDEAWKCSALPATHLSCWIDGAVLQPGHQHSVDMVLDVSGLTGSPNWRFRNCATLDGSGDKRCVWGGGSHALVVTKSGPFPHPCIAGGPCDFQLSVINLGNRTFDGTLFFGDNLTIGGAAVGGINVDWIAPHHGCVIVGATLPLEWQCHVTIPPSDQKTFNLALSIPVGAGPAIGFTVGRNCFVAADPHLVLVGGVPPADFWAKLLNPLNPPAASGNECIDFAVQAPLPGQIIPPRVIIGLPAPGFWPLPGVWAKMKMTITANPNFFNNIGDLITFTYKVQNIGNVKIQTFQIKDIKVKPVGFIGNCDKVSIPVGASATCSAVYAVVAADIGNNIITPANVTGTW